MQLPSQTLLQKKDHVTTFFFSHLSLQKAVIVLSFSTIKEIMDNAELTNCLTFLHQVASECKNEEVSQLTILRLTNTFSQLSQNTSFLLSNNQRGLPHFLQRVIPVASNLFKASFDLNRNVSSRTLLFMSLLHGVSTYAMRDKRLEVVLSAVPECMRKFAAEAHHEKIQVLLNVLRVVASISSKVERKTTSIPFVNTFVSRQRFVREQAFLEALSAILRGLIISQDEITWSHKQYVNISVSMSSSLRLLLRCHDGVGSPIETYNQVYRLLFSLKEPLQRNKPLLLVSLCTGIFYAGEKAKMSSSSYRGELWKFIDSVLSSHLEIVSALGKLPKDVLIPKRLEPAVTMLVLLSWIPSCFSSLASSQQLRVIREATQVLMATSCHSLSTTTASPEVAFNIMVQETVAKHHNAIEESYARIVQAERCFASALGFLSELASEYPTRTLPFSTTITTAGVCKYLPDVAVGFIDILSLSRNHTRTVFIFVNEKLAPHVSTDSSSIRILLKLVVSLMCQLSSKKHLHRASFLLSTLSSVLKSSITARQDASLLHVHEENEAMWLWLVNLIIEHLQRNVDSSNYVSACMSLSARVIRSANRELLSARESLLTRLPELLVQHFIFEEKLGNRRRRLLQTLLILDAISQSPSIEAYFRKWLSMIGEAGKQGGIEAERTAGLLLFRAVVKCHPSLVGVSIDGASAFIGSDVSRKERLLPLAQAAVLGTDSGRKAVCVEWILECFGDLARTTKRNHKIPSHWVSSDQINAKL